MLHIYIISLKQDIERRSVISKKLESFDLNYSFIDAVYGKELSNKTLDLIRSRSCGKIIDRKFEASSGEVGCTLSHLKVYHDILQNKLNWACILEDDVILDERFKIFINTFHDNAMNQKNLYLLGGQNASSEVHIVKSIRNNLTVGGHRFDKTIKSESFIYGACCYLVSSYLAKSILQLSEGKFILADDWKYLSENNIISSIYLANFVDHPSDLYASHLQEERELAGSKSTLANIRRKRIFLARVKDAIKWRLRVIPLNLYTHIEKKDIT